MLGPTPNPNPNSDPFSELPYMGKQGAEMLALWKAQLDWLALVGQNAPAGPQDSPQNLDGRWRNEQDPSNG
jgi:hypothetical protein